MRAHATGVFIAPAEFSHEATWVVMKDFYENLNRLHESHWAQALDFDSYGETEKAVDESMLSTYRVDFYLPSSPTKSDA